MVRTEELLNFAGFDLAFPAPDSGRDFELTSEFAREGEKGFLFLGIQSRKALPKQQNIVLLLDTSGSMKSKKPQLRMAIATVFARMNEGDIFSIVTYSSEDHVFINGMKKNAKHDVGYVLDRLKDTVISGFTNGSKGIETAYDIAVEKYIEGGLNRVIMLTDGDLNFGVTQNGQLGELIASKRRSGVYFSAIGCGLYNLRDDKLEALARNGNGNYYVVNSVKDAEISLRDRYEALVFPVAKNVKAQVEFNPAAVKSYRLTGFENRKLAAEDFRDDSVAAEPFGSGDKCVAFYELYFSEASGVPEFRYGKSAAANEFPEELCTLTLRYEKAEDGGSAPVEIPFRVSSAENVGPNISLAKEVAGIAETLRTESDNGLRRRALSRLAVICGYRDDEDAE